MSEFKNILLESLIFGLVSTTIISFVAILLHSIINLIHQL